MTAFAWTPVLSHVTPVGALSAQLGRPRRRSATSGLRRLQPSPVRKRRAFPVGLANGANRPEIGIGGRLATPPLPHRRAYGSHGGSTELGLGGRTDLGKTERLEIGVA